MGGGLTYFATKEASLINSFANDPAILPHLGYSEGVMQVDVTSRVNDGDLVFVTDGNAAMICFQRVPDGWEFHSMFRPGCRGRAAINAAFDMFVWFTRRIGSFHLIGICPVNNRSVRWFCRQLGMASKGIRENAIVGPVEYFEKDLLCL